MDVNTESSRANANMRAGRSACGNYTLPIDYVPLRSYVPMAFPRTSNAAGCGDGKGSAIVLPEGWHLMQDGRGEMRFFDLTGRGSVWQDDTTIAVDCRLARPSVDHLLQDCHPTLAHLDYGTNDFRESGVPLVSTRSSCTRYCTRGPFDIPTR